MEILLNLLMWLLLAQGSATPAPPADGGNSQVTSAGVITGD